MYHVIVWALILPTVLGGYIRAVGLVRWLRGGDLPRRSAHEMVIDLVFDALMLVLAVIMLQRAVC